MSISIAVADDHTIMREGLVRQLEADPQMKVVIQATNGLDLLKQLSAVALPDIIVLDLNMPVMDGFTLSARLKQKYPHVCMLVLSAYCSDYNIALMVHNGIRGYLLKDCSPAEFRKAIHAIYETGYYYSSLVNEHTFKMLQGANPRAINIPEREMDFLKLCCTDLRYDQIAQKMGITMNTLDGCRERLFDRLGISSRIALVLFAMQSGIVTTESQPKKLRIKI